MHFPLKGVTILTLAALASTLGAAQFEITPTVGKKIHNKDSTLKDKEILYGVRATAYAKENIGLQAAFETSADNETATGGKTDIERGSIGVLVEKKLGRVRPYAIVGVGYEQTHGNDVKTTNDDSQMFYDAGVGLKVDVNHRIDVVTEIKGIHKVENGDDDVIATLGVGVKLGGVVAQKRPATCSQPKAMSLEQFSKMCKTKKSVSQPVVAQAPMPVVQSEPVVVEEEVSTTVTEPTSSVVEGEIIDEKIVEEIPEVKLSNCEIASEEGDLTLHGPTSLEVGEEVQSESVGGEIPEGYYVQMAALFKGEPSLLTNRLKRKHYPYTLYQVQRFGKDATLVLVGPYESKQAARIALRYLKRLSPKAFVKRFP